MHRRNIRTGVLARRFTLCLVAAGTTFLFPQGAAAWGQRAHLRIAELALEELPPVCRGQIVLYKDNLLQGAGENKERKGETDRATIASRTVTDIQLLMLIPHDGTHLSHYFAYRLGMLSRALADFALPLSYPSGSSDRMLQEKFESDIDGDVDTFRIHN
ncbi:MAG: hypothetical protein JSV16_12565, partial [Candidatus Hydrogenedentota bacterium]